MYYYKATISKKSGRIRERQGVIPAAIPSDAMDTLEDMAEGWGATILRCTLSEIDENGEIVLMTTHQPANLTKHNKNVVVPKRKAHIPTPQPHIFGSPWIAPTFLLKKMEDTK